jgi:hypothetical protein
MITSMIRRGAKVANVINRPKKPIFPQLLEKNSSKKLNLKIISENFH